MDSTRSTDALDNALAYLLEEQHTILETYQGDLESVLVNAHIEEEHANNMVANSLAFRISRDKLHAYMDLLNYLAGVNNTRGWET